MVHPGPPSLEGAQNALAEAQALAEKANYLETAYLIVFGRLPTAPQLASWERDVMNHSMLHTNIQNLIGTFRYDAHLVPELLANVAPLSDGWVAFDDRAGAGLFSDEARRRRALLTAAGDAGAAWALAVDPDERFEGGLAAAIDRLTAIDEPVAYTFALRELYAPDAYRVDGVWGSKRQARLLWLGGGVTETALSPFHASWAALLPRAELRETPFNLYHLKMIAPRRRRARARLYNHLDPERKMQAIGYDYLADESGASFESIAAGREYQPPHVDDGGLWMAEPPPAE